MGIEHFFLYDNFSADDPATTLAHIIKTGQVTLIPWRVPIASGGQAEAYADCLVRSRDRARWVAFLDIDEFLFAPGGSSLTDTLADHDRHPGVVAHWQVYGSSGHLVDDPRDARDRAVRPPCPDLVGEEPAREEHRAADENTGSERSTRLRLHRRCRRR